MRNPAVEHNVAAFSELSFDARWLGRPSKASNSTTKLLTTGAMVDNLTEKVDECPLNSGH